MTQRRAYQQVNSSGEVSGEIVTLAGGAGVTASAMSGRTTARVLSDLAIAARPGADE